MAILLLFVLRLLQHSTSLFCSSYCAGQWTCGGTTKDNCFACEQSIFNLNANMTTGQCDLLNQTEIFAYDLSGVFTLDGFQTNSPILYNCTTSYPLSGNYGTGSYLAKTYSELPIGHYYVMVKFNVAYMGTWTSTDMIAVNVDGNQSSWNYSCSQPALSEALCTATDCIRSYQTKQNHSDTSLTVNITSTLINSPPIQSWGVKDLIIALKTCHSNCVTCYGPLSTQCYLCSQGFFLLGNTCVQACPDFTVRSAGVCLQTCPDSYYSLSKDCQMCDQSCVTCRGPTESDCITSFQKISIWNQNIELWILILVLALTMVGFGAYCLVIRYRKHKELDNKQIKEKMLMSQINITSKQEPASKIYEFPKKKLQGNVLMINNTSKQEIVILEEPQIVSIQL